MTADTLQGIIDLAWEGRDQVSPASTGEVRNAVEAALDGLDSGHFRVAEKRDGSWVVNQWLKKAVLLSFRLRDTVPVSGRCCARATSRTGMPVRRAFPFGK